MVTREEQIALVKRNISDISKMQKLALNIMQKLIDELAEQSDGQDMRITVTAMRRHIANMKKTHQMSQLSIRDLIRLTGNERNRCYGTESIH